MAPSVRPTTLDGWYLMVNGIYYDRNFYRDVESLMCHLVEVVGALSVVASKKVRHEGDRDEWVDRFLAKSLGWWMVLCGKVGVKSVGDLLWAKFPRVCPYCRLSEHRHAACESARELRHDPDWTELARLGEERRSEKPQSLAEWRKMFDKIYQRSDQTSQETNFARLTEELGELAEAVRVLPITRSYFVSEATDVFAWLMGVANQLRADDYRRRVDERRWHGDDEHLNEILWREYPGVCGYCNSPSCKCPPIPAATMNRIAKEGPPVDPTGAVALFGPNEAMEFFRLGEEVLVGGISLRTGEIQRDIAKLALAVRAAAAAMATESEDLRRRIDEVGSRLEALQTSQQEAQLVVDDAIAALGSLPSPVLEMLVQMLVSIDAGLIVEIVRTVISGR
jgi:NTP pyrophosphatase (non-canonical NTP hydrolase)